MAGAMCQQERDGRWQCTSAMGWQELATPCPADKEARQAPLMLIGGSCSLHRSWLARCVTPQCSCTAHTRTCPHRRQPSNQRHSHLDKHLWRDKDLWGSRQVLCVGEERNFMKRAVQTK